MRRSSCCGSCPRKRRSEGPRWGGGRRGGSAGVAHRIERFRHLGSPEGLGAGSAPSHAGCSGRSVEESSSSRGHAASCRNSFEACPQLRPPLLTCDLMFFAGWGTKNNNDTRMRHTTQRRGCHTTQRGGKRRTKKGWQLYHPAHVGTAISHHAMMGKTHNNIGDYVRQVDAPPHTTTG